MQRLVSEFRSFLMVGGMPVSVSAWIETQAYSACQDEQNDIQQSYYDDFAKYSRKVDPQILRNTLSAVVRQSGQKFVYSRVEGGYKTEEVKEALVNKGIVSELTVGLELVKSSNPQSKYDLFYWENLERNTISEVEYVIAKSARCLPIEVKRVGCGEVRDCRA